MEFVYITFRSVTPAQQAERLLRREGISCSLRRTPRYMEEQGCGYSLQLDGGDVPKAVGLFTEGKIPFRKVYSLRDGGRLEEVRL